MSEQEKTVAAQPKRVILPSLGTSGMWTSTDEWRAPLGDFPPPWASAWGDDPYGLWADLTVNGVTQRMRWIEPSGPEGFWMGSSKAERDAIKDKAARDWANSSENEHRKVIVRDGFWLADTPCTQAFWRAVTRRNPSNFRYGFGASDRPVEQVSWISVMRQFVDRFAETPDWGTGDRVCLPNEKQWEYATRAGAVTAYWWGDESGDLYAHWNRSRHDITRPVKSFAPNPYGLFDVHGNVWEWCDDVWRDMLGSPHVRMDGTLRVVRGGSWIDLPARARAAYRFRWPTDGAQSNRGFRFALRSPGRPESRGIEAGR
jgi:formylglycine-generating enzyme